MAAHWRRQSPDATYVEGVEGSEDDGQTLPAGGAACAGGAGDDEDDAALVRQPGAGRPLPAGFDVDAAALRVGFAGPAA